MTGPGDERWMARRRDDIASGRIANGRIVRTYADIEIAREDGDLALMFYLQRREAPTGSSAATLPRCAAGTTRVSGSFRSLAAVARRPGPANGSDTGATKETTGA